MQREGFIFYQSFRNATKHLPNDNQKNALVMIVQYGIDGVEPNPETDPVAYAMFLMAKPQLDKNNQKYTNGKDGGRPPKDLRNISITKDKPKLNQTVTKPKAKEKEKENVNVKENDKEKDIKTLSIDKKEQSSFGDPDINEIFSIVASYNEGITDDTKTPKSRGIGKHLINKLLSIEKVKNGNYSWQEYLRALLTVVAKNTYHRHKISGVGKIYNNLAELIHIANSEVGKEKEKEDNRPLSAKISL